jgi:hypothetical protein
MGKAMNTRFYAFLIALLGMLGDHPVQESLRAELLARDS